MSAEKPKPCPWCGEPPVWIEREETWLLACMAKRCSATPRVVGYDRDVTLRRWNTRRGESR